VALGSYAIDERHDRGGRRRRQVWHGVGLVSMSAANAAWARATMLGGRAFQVGRHSRFDM
jgi:hypothetical protein